MLTLEQINAAYPPEVTRTRGRASIVEYLQYELLDSIFSHKESAALSFIGGTAIRIVYNGTRFSEDLDFDLFDMTYEAFASLLDDVVLDMRHKGLELEFRMVKKGAYHGYIRFPGVLGELGLSPHEGEKILVRVDAMPKEYAVRVSEQQLNRFGVYRTIRVNSASVILAQKLLAVLERKRERGRDLFDVCFLYGMTEPDWAFVHTTTGMEPRPFLDAVLSRVKTFDLEELAKDVAPFLLRPHEVDRVLLFEQFLRDVTARVT